MNIMSMNLISLLVDKNEKMDVGTGALYSLVAILMVFAILLIFIAMTTLVFKLVSIFEEHKKASVPSKKEEIKSNTSQVKNEKVVITDDDMMAAVLIATIDYRNEVKKDVKVISVKEL